ncbi:MAG: alpha-glucan family phosphorylase [Candidatus Lokiarchaeota archaeon]|nr:alpha-glucan family phosphorylase [Candidatus Lokiarchaeota archaeon]
MPKNNNKYCYFMRERPSIAYFSMEIGLESDIPTYSGGLGVLAGDILHKAVDLEIPMIAVSLCYSAGYFYQMIGPYGDQISKNIRWQFSSSFEKIPITITIEIQGKEFKVGAWVYNIIGKRNGFIIPVFLLDSNIEGNPEWFKKIAHTLYTAQQFTRIVQEAILGIGGVKLIYELCFDNIETFHLNEGHSSFTILELLKRFKTQEKVKKRITFTTHTPVPAGHETFDYNLAYNVLGNMLPDNIRELAGNDKLNMTRLALNMSRYVNAVSKKHLEVTQEMFPGYEIDSITNGVNLFRWMSPYIKELYDEIMPEFRYDPQIIINAPVEIDSHDLWTAHKKAKGDLMDYEASHSHVLLDDRVLTLAFGRRFTSYKRPTLIFSDLDRLGKICKDKVQIIFAGKAHPMDNEGKYLIKKIHESSDYLWDNYRVSVAFLENYDMDLAKLIISGSDVWLNTPRSKNEASGTSGMKAALNATLNCSTMDGWWIEGYKMSNLAGWAICPKIIEGECSSDSDESVAEAFYHILENEIIPTFYGNRDQWIKRMKNAILLASYFNCDRAVKEYATRAWNMTMQPRWRKRNSHI